MGAAAHPFGAQQRSELGVVQVHLRAARETEERLKKRCERFAAGQVHGYRFEPVGQQGESAYVLCRLNRHRGQLAGAGRGQEHGFTGVIRLPRPGEPLHARVDARDNGSVTQLQRSNLAVSDDGQQQRARVIPGAVTGAAGACGYCLGRTVQAGQQGCFQVFKAAGGNGSKGGFGGQPGAGRGFGC